MRDTSRPAVRETGELLRWAHWAFGPCSSDFPHDPSSDLPISLSLSPSINIMDGQRPLPSTSLRAPGLLPSGRPTSPLPHRAGPLASRISRPNLSRKLSRLSALGPSASTNLPLTPSANRKRDRSAWPTTSYASFTSSPSPQPSSPSFLKHPSSSFQVDSPSSQPVAAENLMSLCQQYSYSHLNSPALDYFGKAKEVVSTHTRTIRSGLGLGSDSKPKEDEQDLEPETERATKRRKGVAGSIISTALDVAIDAAIFTSAVGCKPVCLPLPFSVNIQLILRFYSDAAFQIWRGKPLEEPVRPQLPSPVPLTPPPPYERCPSSPPRPRPSPITRTPSSQRKVTHVHVSRPRPSRSYLSSNSSICSSIPNFTLDSLNLNTPTTRTPAQAPEDDDDLMGDFVPSFSHYVPPPPVPEEPVDVELEADEELVAWKNQIRGLIRSGEAALAAPAADIPALVEPEPESTPARTSMKVERLKRSEEIQILERALDQTMKGSGRKWWESC